MVSNSAQAIAQLAQLRDPTKRSQLALGVTEMCLAQPLSPTAEPVAGELLVTLSGTLDRPTKIAMVEKLSASEWAPHAAIRHFAFDEIEVACIVIRKSPRLTQRDMISLAETGSADHRRHLASRPNLCPAITDALAKPAEAVILRALANNCTAQISESTLNICLGVAREHMKLREALARRHDLSADYATQLCIMLPENWREDLYRRFGLDKEHVEGLAVEAALNATPAGVDSEASEAVDAAEQSGALTGNYALTALRAGKFAIFDHAVARLCGLTPAQWRVALTMGGVRAAAMACQASGLDRTDYPTVHRALQRTGRMHQQLEGEAMNAAANVFRMYGPDKAATVLRQLGSRS
ncbi:DUF2336 domain-containing protein [Maricaulis sp.]|uniref:DUF2336 domain-containing protein n=1 Tax=Maricaulis sp. TaxID=1486257 RepID=UPI003A90CD25